LDLRTNTGDKRRSGMEARPYNYKII